MRVVMPLRALAHYSTEVANGLALAGSEVLSIYPEGSNEWMVEPELTLADSVRQVLQPGVTGATLDYPPTTNLRTATANLRTIYRLYKMMARFKPDVIQFQANRDYRMYMAARLMARRSPFVYTVHDARPHLAESWDRIMHLVHAKYMRNAARLVCLSEAVKHLLVEQGVAGERIDVIPHPAHVLFRHWLEPEHTRDDSTVLFFGRMNKYKGIGVLLESIPLVRREVPAAKFVIAGGGAEVDSYSERLREHSNVEVIARRIANHEVAPLFAKASVLAMPYLEASQSGVVTIAYAFDTPVVATDVGGLPEAVEHGKTGLIVPPGDPEKLAEALVRILSDPGYRQTLTANIRELANGPLSLKTIGEQLTECYEKAIKQHRGR